MFWGPQMTLKHCIKHTNFNTLYNEKIPQVNEFYKSIYFHIH